MSNPKLTFYIEEEVNDRSRIAIEESTESLVLQQQALYLKQLAMQDAELNKLK